MATITTFLTFNDQAAQAIALYTSIFPNSKVTHEAHGPDGKLFTATFVLDGVPFMALNGGPQFTFAMGHSLFVSVETQAEVDRIWDRLIADGGEAQRCGWLKDKFGVFWQIIPTALGRLLGHEDKARAQRVMQAMMGMVKIDIAGLENA